MDRGRRSMSWSPPKWRTESLRVEDVKRCLEAAKRLGSLTTQSSESSEINEDCHSRDHTVGLRPVKLESDSSASAEAPQMNHGGRKSREEEHLHGSGWQDPICSLFQQESGSWQDPICTLFQTSTLATCPAQNLETGGSYSLETPLRGSDAPCRKQNGAACVDLAVREQELTGAPKPASQNMASSSSHFQGRHRENVFRDMGLPPAQIQRAIQTCGAQADDPIILQFPHDWRENKRQVNQKEFKRDTKLVSEENVSDVSLTVRQQIANSMRRNGAEELWDSDNSDYSENDEEQAVNLPRSPIDWAEAERGADLPVTLCKRELPNGEGHRRLMLNHGFHAELVERAIRELGEGVEYDMLLEYLLYLTAHEDPKASTSRGSLQKRANSAREPGYPTKPKASSEKQVSTVEKLVAECGYPAKAVERAISICETPMWNAGQDQIADLVDFLTAHGGELNESEPDLDAKEDEVDDADWSWLRQHVVEDGREKRKVGNVGAARRKTINRLSRPPHADLEDGLRMTSTRGKRKLGYVSRGMTRPAYLRRNPVNHVKLEELDELDEPSFSRRHNVKLEPFDELDIDTRDKPRRPARVKRQFFDDEPVHQLMSRRSQPSRVSARIGRPAREVVPAKTVTLDRHHGSIGFGLPGNPVQPRYLDEDVKGAPFFYFENVASMPNDEWERIRRHLFDIEPEFVDSLHFSACRRPRGYIHNLPIEGRRKILKDPPMTIQELLPHTKAFWPDWDPRTKLNCITTRMGSEFLIKKLQIGDGTSLQTKDPSPDQQREILHLCRHWNLVWTAPNIPTPIDEIEIEAMLGFDPGHSRNILSNRSRYKALGNSFSVYTIAFHFSVLKPLFPRGIKLLSLFSGIGGAEVALHKMGIKLQVVVSVEIDDGTRRCLEAWWAASKQAGVLNQNYHNIKDLGRAQITELVNMYGGFDLIVGGTPCNNLSGSNHVTRVGLDGKQSTVFFEFSRVVAAVRELTIRLHQKSK